MVGTQICASPSILVRGVSRVSSATMAISGLPRANLATFGTAFVSGSSPLLMRATSRLTRPALRAASFSIRCEKGGDGLDVWLGRTAMVGFGVAVSTEVVTGKGLLETFGLSSPLPTVVLVAAGLAGIVAAILIFQSASNSDYT